MLPDYGSLNPNLDYLSCEEVVRLQSERLRAQVKHCWENAPFWRKKLDSAGVAPDHIRGIEDLQKVPFCTKEELQKDQEENPPFGSYLAVDRSMLTIYFTTSGTTGKPIVRTFSRRDWQCQIEKYLRNPGVGPGDVAVIMGPTDGLFGPTMIAATNSAAGALVVKASRYSTEDKVRLVHSLRPSAVSATTSFLLYLASIADQMGLSFHKMGGVRDLLCYGEPGSEIEGTKKRLLKGWGAKRIVDQYGITEVGAFLGYGCRESGQIHICNDFVIVEVIDPKSNKALAPGQRGELVFTNIFGETQPLLRYRSRDVAKIEKFGPCPACGKTLTRIVSGIEGRVDDMIWYKGINIFPSGIEAVVRGFRELSGEYEIIVDQLGEAKQLTIRAEVAPQIGRSDYISLSDQLKDKLLGALEGVHANVELVVEGTLPKVTDKTGKTRRIQDNKPRKI